MNNAELLLCLITTQIVQKQNAQIYMKRTTCARKGEMIVEFVEPIRDRNQLSNMKNYLKGRNLRDWLLFILGINSGLRISDLLSLQVEDVKECNRIKLWEKKLENLKTFQFLRTVERQSRNILRTRD